MSSLLLAWRNANSNGFRRWTILTCAALMAGFAVAAALIIGGAQSSLKLALERLGADIIVMPEGSEQDMENAFLMGVPVSAWMPRDVLGQVEAIAGVEAVSPQCYLTTLRGATCCSVPEMFLIAYDPATDFTLRPWLEQHQEEGLAPGQAVGGSFVYVPADPGVILIYGSEIDLQGNLEATGTGLDQSMFFTFETAQEIARLSKTEAEKELVIPSDSISAVMVKLRPGADAGAVARQIRQTVRGVTPVESTNLFYSQRVQIVALLQSVAVLLGVAWLLSVALIGLVFSMAVNERRREIGVLRALGLPRRWVLGSLLAEGLILAAAGGIAGIVLCTAVVYLFRNLIIQVLGVPFGVPSPFALLALAVGALLLALGSETLGALVPTLRVGLMEPALAMRK